MTSHVIELFYHFIPALALLASIEVWQLALYLKHTTTKETYRKMYTVWIIILLAMLLLNLAFIWEVFFHNLAFYQLFELMGIVLFVGAMVMVRRGIVSVGVLLGLTGELRSKVSEKTNALKAAKDQLEEYSKSLEKMVEGRTKELQGKLKELTEARTALINMMDDVEAANIFLRNSVDRLKEVDRMKDQLLSNVSHELRTPITIVKSALELLMDENVSNEQGKLVTMSKSNLNRLDTLVGDLLYFSKGQKEIPEEEIEKISLKDVVKEAVHGISHMAEINNIKITTFVDKNIPELDASKPRLLQVLTNLLGNAIKFNKEKGSIKIKAALKKSDDNVTVSVSDTGVGIPKEQLPRIFDRFYQVDGTTSRKYGGTGLGLAITKSIVEAHGGKIWVESVVGEGTTFHFTLPIKRKKKYIVTLPLGEKEKWQR
jgi:signal transduction histidine kinase